MATSTNFLIKNAILSYPHLYKTEIFQGGTDTNQYAATFLFDDQDTYDRLWELGMETAAEEFGNVKKIPKNFKKTERCCINEVSLSEEEDGIDFDGWSIKAKGGSTRSGSPKRIVTVDAAKQIVTGEDGQDDENGIFYPGCRVDAQITLWTAASYAHLRSNLLLVQFRDDGPRLGGNGGVNAVDLLDEMDSYDDEADI